MCAHISQRKQLRHDFDLLRSGWRRLEQLGFGLHQTNGASPEMLLSEQPELHLCVRATVGLNRYICR